MITNAVARWLMNSNAAMRPPRPAKQRMNSSAPLPGALISNAVARSAVNSKPPMRPLRPAMDLLNSIRDVPGALSFTNGA